MPRVLVAFDKFRGCLTALQAGRIAARAIARAQPTWSVEIIALSDGGEGFCDALTQAAGGQLHSVACHDPLGRLTSAQVGVVEVGSVPSSARQLLRISGGRPEVRLMVAEMAQASGLALLDSAERDPWRCSSFGTGELLAQAGGLGAAHVVLGVGGSATSDLGLGALSALGLRCLDADGQLLDPRPEQWPRIATLERATLAGVPPVFVACDVTNPLFGPEGAAAVYGPQKGLSAADLPRHEALAGPLAQQLLRATGGTARSTAERQALVSAPGAGAAGGIAFGLMAGLDAQIVPGFSLISDWLDLSARIERADWVLSGEGSFDSSSLSGKATGSLLGLCNEIGRPCRLFAGRVSQQCAELAEALSPASLDLEVALAECEGRLEAAVGAWALRPK